MSVPETLDLSELSIQDALTQSAKVALGRIRELEKLVCEREAHIEKLNKSLLRAEERMDKSKYARLVWEAEHNAERWKHISESQSETIQSLVAERKALKAMAKLQEIQSK